MNRKSLVYIIGSVLLVSGFYLGLGKFVVADPDINLSSKGSRGQKSARMDTEGWYSVLSVYEVVKCKR